MSRSFESVEPSVIDQKMLQDAVEEQGPKDEAKQLFKKEGFPFTVVTSLSLSFKNILNINNLWEFKALTKLQLDNNIIERIEFINELVNLVWLDLSFNNIEYIEGLDALTKLQDLSLYNNQIQKIQNLDYQTDLRVFSIGNNDIKDIKDIMYMRRFSKLQSLNIATNPVCDSEGFRPYILAYLPSLQYLDYKLIDTESKVVGYMTFKDQIDEQRDMERAARNMSEISQRTVAQNKLYQKAFVNHIHGGNLFKEMFNGDVDGNKLKQMPGAEELLCVFKEKFLQICFVISEFGLSEYEKRKAEEDMFWECINEAKKDNNELGSKAISEYLKAKNKLFLEMQNLQDAQLIDSRLNEFQVTISDLFDELMMYELQLVEQLEETIKDFEHNMQDLAASFLENVQGNLGELREQENIFYEKMVECATISIERLAKNENEEDFTEDVKMLLIDKDIGLGAVTSSHDYHLLKIDDTDDYISTGIRTWMKNLIEDINQKENIDRNRARVIEINVAIDNMQFEIKDLEIITDEDQSF